MLHCVNILGMELRSHNCHSLFLQALDYFVYAARSESIQTQRTGVYLIDKVVHQQVVLYDSGCELLVIHHILKQTRIPSLKQNSEKNPLSLLNGIIIHQGISGDDTSVNYLSCIKN